MAVACCDVALALAGAAAFDLEYARWVEEHHRLMCDLRAALQSRLADTELRVLVSTMHLPTRENSVTSVGAGPLKRSVSQALLPQRSCSHSTAWRSGTP